MASAAARLNRFQQEMESLYGNLSTIANPSTWIPPPRSGGHHGRYLWTDAFGVINFITLHQEYQEYARITGDNPRDGKYLTLAGRLIETVHNILGRTRDGMSRLPRATDENPLGGGLRIGKVDECGPDGDGQYHHYLTLWMFALNRMSMATGDPTYNSQAVALAKAIHPHFFVHRTSSRPRMVWKMSVDLSEQLVSSEGNLDPIDGFVIFRLLQAFSMRHNEKKVLEEEIKDYKRVIERKGEHFVSSDPLDLGMTLWTAHWFYDKESWALDLAEKCFEQTYYLFAINRYMEHNIKYRLAFREFGTCLGIHCYTEEVQVKGRTINLGKFADAVINQWVPHMEVTTCMGVVLDDDLRPINKAMYAAALIPGGEFLPLSTQAISDQNQNPLFKRMQIGGLASMNQLQQERRRSLFDCIVSMSVIRTARLGKD